VLGFDVMLDDKLKAWLIEVNASPSLSSSSPLDKAIKVQLMADTFHLLGVPVVDAAKVDIGPRGGCVKVLRSESEDPITIGISPIHAGQAAYTAASKVLKYSYLAMILCVFIGMLYVAGVDVTSDHLKTIQQAVIKLIDLRDTSGRPFSMVCFIVALHTTMWYVFQQEFACPVLALAAFNKWKFTWHSNVGAIDVTDERRLDSGWIDRCERQGLDPKTATKWEVAGGTGVTDERRLDSGWIDRCEREGLDPKTATKQQLAKAIQLNSIKATKSAKNTKCVEAAMMRQAQRGTPFNDQCPLTDTAISDAGMAVFVDYFIVKQQGHGNVCDAMSMLTFKYPNIPMNKALKKRFIIQRALAYTF